MEVQPQAEHVWLSRLVGEWVYESETSMGPDKPALKSTGTESVQTLGEIWTQLHSEGIMPSGKLGRSIMTLGYDPQAAAFVGTWIGDMMAYMWVYRGQLNPAKTVLTLESQGMNFEQTGMTTYQDIIEVVSDDHRILNSRVLMSDGTWNHFITTHFRRKQ